MDMRYVKRIPHVWACVIVMLLFPGASPETGGIGTMGMNGERGVEWRTGDSVSGWAQPVEERAVGNPGPSGEVYLIREEEQGVEEFRRGDILVKANHNWLPGSAQVWGGKGFGHAALVLQGARDTSLLRLLENTLLFESHSRDVPDAYQLREVAAYLPGPDFRSANITFGPQNLGYCYRLRPALSPEDLEKFISFVTSLDEGRSSWRAQKRFAGLTGPVNPERGEDPGHWYCSLVIWQAFYTLFGVDLDPNGGVMVYPNDLIASPYFNNSPENTQKRVRF